MNPPRPEVKPPNFPKPVRSQEHLERERLLKNRLKLKWGSTSSSFKDTVPFRGNSNGSPRIDGISVKGFGEQHFADSVIDEPPDAPFSVDLAAPSSVWTEAAQSHPNKALDQSLPQVQNPNTVLHNGGGEPIKSPRFLDITMSSTVGRNPRNASTFTNSQAHDRFLDQASMSLMEASSTTMRHNGFQTQQPSSLRPRKMFRTHLDMSQSFAEEGYPTMIQSLVSDTEFCYVESSTDNFYQFGVKSTIPMSIIQNEYTTISARGLLRAAGEDSELVPFHSLAREADIYAKLGKLKLFRTYRLWKMFLVWKKTVHTHRHANRTKLIAQHVVLSDPLCRDLVFACRSMLDELRRFPVLLKDDKVMPFADFLVEQRKQNARFMALKKDLFQRMVDFLCEKCEHYVFSSAGTAPDAVTNAKYRSMRMNAAASGNHLQEAASTADEIVHIGLTATMSQHPGLHENTSTVGTSSGPMPPSSTHKGSQHAKASPRVRLGSEKPTVNSNSIQESLQDDDNSSVAGSLHSSVNFNFDVGVSYTIRAAIRMHCRKLVSLFRILDFMVRDTLYEVLQVSVKAYHQWMTMVSTKNHLIADFGISPPSVEESNAERSASLASPSKTVIPQTPLFIVGTMMHRRGHDEVAEIQSRFKSGSSDGGGEAGGVYDTDQTKHSGSSDDMALSSSSADSVGEVTLGQFDGIAFLPPVEKSITDFQQLLRETCLVFMYPEGLFFHERCIRMFEPVRSELMAHQLEDRVFLDSPHNDVQAVLRRCMNIFADDYRYVAEQMMNLNVLCLESNRCEVTCQRASSNRLQGVAADDITMQLNQWDEQLTRFRELHGFVVLGIFRIDLNQLRSTIADILTKAQSLYLRIIPDLYVHYGDDFYNEVSKYVDHLVTKVSALEDFIRSVEAYNFAVTKVNMVNEKYMYISSLRNIVEARGISISDAILRQNLTLRNAYQRFTNNIAEFENNLEIQVKVYTAEIATRLKQVMVPIHELQAYILSINNALLTETREQDASAILVQLQRYRKEIDTVSAKLKQLDYYQTLLNATVFEKGLERDVDETLTANILLWKTHYAYSELTQNFMTVNFLDAHCDGVLKDLLLMQTDLTSTRYFQRLHEIILHDTLGTESSGVKGIYQAYESLLSNVRQMIQVAPLVKQLQSSTLKRMHIEEIHRLVDFEIFEESDLTVGELVDVQQIMQFASGIHKVYTESKLLFNLETKIVGIEMASTTLQFEFAVEQESKSLMYVCNFEELLGTVTNFEDSLLACQNSRYSGTLKGDLEVGIHLVGEWVTLLGNFKYFQGHYLNFRVLFTSPRTARQMSPYMRQFKQADEHWRTIVKAARDMQVVNEFVLEKNIPATLKHAVDNIDLINKGFRELRLEQCERYPKLFLMEASALEAVYLNQDIKAVFLECCKVVFPFIVDDVIFDYQEAYNVNTLICLGEKLVFQKSCSGRTNLADWLRACELAVRERFEKDIKSLTQDESRPITDEVRSGRYTGQSLLVRMQTRFWMTLDRILLDPTVDDKHEVLAKLKAYLIEINDQITIISSILSDPIPGRTILLVSNTIMTYCHFRDILQAIYDDFTLYLSLGEDLEGPLKSIFQFSSMQYPLKKIIDPVTGVIMVEQGCYREKYGMTYQGCNHKLVMTPLTERCLYALTTTFRDLKHCPVPLLSGQSNTFTMQSLAYEMGVEYFHFDVTKLSAAGGSFYEKLSSVMKVILQTGLWATLSVPRSVTLSAEHTAILGNVVSSFVRKMQEMHQQYAVRRAINPTAGSAASASNNNSSNATDQFDHDAAPGFKGKLFLINIPRLLPTLKNAQVTFHYLRPIHTPHVPIRTILQSMLLSYNFVFVSKLITQLEALQDFLVAHGLVDEKMFRRMLFRAVHVIGLENEHNMMNASTQMMVICKKFMSQLLQVHQKLPSEQELRLIFNLFFESVYNPETDAQDICPTDVVPSYALKNAHHHKHHHRHEQSPHEPPPTPLARITDALQQQNLFIQARSHLTSAHMHTCICVVGPSGSGKSSLIRSAFAGMEEILFNTPGKSLEVAADFIKLCPTVLNPVLLSPQSSLRTVSTVFGDINDQAGLLHAVGSRMKTSTSSRDWFFFHLDVFSSDVFVDHVVPLQHYADQRFPLLASTTVCEMTEIRAMDPQVLAKINLVIIPPPTRSKSAELVALNESFERALNKYAVSGGPPFRIAVRECIEQIIRPCMTSFVATLSTQGLPPLPQSSQVLVDRICNTSAALFSYYSFPQIMSGSGNGAEEATAAAATSTSSTSKKGKKPTGCVPRAIGRFDDESIRRLTIFACIWTVGASSIVHRKAFDTWFRTHFADEHNQAMDKKKFHYPIMEGTTVYDFVLRRIEGKVWLLEWDNVSGYLVGGSRRHATTSMTFGANRNGKKIPGVSAGSLPVGDEQDEDLLYTDTVISVQRVKQEIVLTKDLVALTLLSAAMMHTQSYQENRACGLLIYSQQAQGSIGRSSIIQHLVTQAVHYSRDLFPVATRWIYYSNDTRQQAKSALELQSTLTQTQRHFEYLRIERGLNNYGAIFMDDLAIDVASTSSSSDAVPATMEVIRNILEHHTYFHAPELEWEELAYPTVIATAQIPSRLSVDDSNCTPFNRILQHVVMYQVHEGQVHDVLVHYVRTAIGSGIEHDLLGDMCRFSYDMFNLVQSAVQTESQQSLWVSDKVFSVSEKLLLVSLRDISPVQWTAWTLHQFAATVETLSPAAANDMIRVWDRIISDISVRHVLYPRIQTFFSDAIDTLVNDSSGLYSASSFTGIVEKERSTRMSNLEMLQQSATAPELDEAISYARSSTGFFRTGNDIFPALLPAEYVRDTVWKLFLEEDRAEALTQRYPFYAMMLRINRNVLGFWTDVLRLVTIIAGNRMPCSIALPSLILCTSPYTTSVGSVIQPRAFFAAQFFADTADINVQTLSIGSTKIAGRGHLSVRDVEMRLIVAIFTDEDTLRRLKRHLQALGCQNLVDPTLRDSLISRYGQEIVATINKAETIFGKINITNASAPTPMNRPFQNHNRNQPPPQPTTTTKKKSVETIWILQNDDDMTAETHDPEETYSHFQDMLRLLMFEHTSVYEFLRLVNPVLNPSVYDSIRAALVAFQRRQHIVLSVRTLYADQFGDILRSTKRMVRLVHCHPESEDADKLTKVLEMLQDRLEIGVERNRYLSSLHGFVDWFEKKRQISVNRMITDAASCSAYDVIQRVFDKAAFAEILNAQPKLLTYLLRLSGYQGAIRSDENGTPTAERDLSVILIGQGIPRSFGIRGSVDMGESEDPTSPTSGSILPCFGPALVTACEMVHLTSALRCDAWIVHHLNASNEPHQPSQPLVDTAVNAQDGCIDDIGRLLGCVLHPAFVSNTNMVHALMLNMALMQALVSPKEIDRKAELLQKMIKVFLMLPTKSTAKSIISSFAYGVSGRDPLIMHDYTFLIAPVLDRILDEDLGLGMSASNMADTSIDPHCFTWTLYPDNVATPDNTDLHESVSQNPTVMNVARDDRAAASDLLLYYLLSRGLFRKLDAGLQDAWNKKQEGVSAVMNTMQYLIHHLDEIDQIPEMKFAYNVAADVTASFDELWEYARDKLARVIDANILLTTNVFQHVHSYEKCRQYIAWSDAFLFLLQDSILLQDHDTEEEELYHNFGLASMKMLSGLTNQLIPHEGDRLWVIFSIFLDYFLVVDSSRSEHVMTEQTRHKLLQCLHTLAPSELTAKKFGRDAAFGLIRKAKVVKVRRGKIGGDKSHTLLEGDEENDDDSTTQQDTADDRTAGTAESPSQLPPASGGLMPGLVMGEVEEVKEYNVVAATTRALLKQIMQLVGQALNGGALTDTFYDRYCNGSNNADGDNKGNGEQGGNTSHSANSGMLILSAVESELDSWLEWAADITADIASMPDISDRGIKLHPLEEVLLVLLIKPAILPQILFDKLCEIGYNVNPATVRGLMLSEESVKRGLYTADNALDQKAITDTTTNNADFQITDFSDRYQQQQDLLRCVLHSGGVSQHQGVPILVDDEDDEMLLQGTGMGIRSSIMASRRTSALATTGGKRIKARTPGRASISLSLDEGDDGTRALMSAAAAFAATNDDPIRNPLLTTFLSLPTEVSSEEFIQSVEAMIVGFVRAGNNASSGLHGHTSHSLSSSAFPLASAASNDTNNHGATVTPHSYRRILRSNGGSDDSDGASHHASSSQQQQLIASIDITRPWTLVIRLFFDDDRTPAQVKQTSQSHRSLRLDFHNYWRVFPRAKLQRLLREQYPSLRLVLYADDIGHGSANSDSVFLVDEVEEVVSSSRRQMMLNDLQGSRSDRFSKDRVAAGDGDVSGKDSARLVIRTDEKSPPSLPQSHVVQKTRWHFPAYTPLLPMHSEYSDDVILWRLRNNLRVLFYQQWHQQELQQHLQPKWVQHHAQLTHQLLHHSNNGAVLMGTLNGARGGAQQQQQQLIVTPAKVEYITAVMARLRWLLVLYHTALPYSAPGIAGGRLTFQEPNDAALYQAVAIAEELVYHHVLLLLEPPRSRPQNLHNNNLQQQQQAALEAEEALHRANNSTPVTITITDQFLLAIQEAVICGAYVSNQRHHSMQQQTRDYGLDLRARSVFQSIFAPRCLDPQVSYLVLNAVPLPATFTATSAQGFLSQISEYVDNNPDCGCFEDLGYVNVSLCHQRNLVRWQSGLESYWMRHQLASMLCESSSAVKDVVGIASGNNNGTSMANSTTSSKGAERGNLAALSQPTVYRCCSFLSSDIVNQLQRLLGKLDTLEMDLTSKEVMKQMQAHSLQSEMGTFKGRTTRVALGPQVGTGGNAFMGGAGAKRRQGQRMLLRYQSHEFDSLWAYLLTEVTLFNKRLLNWRRYLQYLSSMSLEALKHHVRHEIAGRGSAAVDCETFLMHLQMGFVPSLWCDAAFLKCIYEDGHPRKYHRSASQLAGASSVSSGMAMIPLETWLQHLFLETHAFLSNWLESGSYPKQTWGTIPLHLLAHPQGLFYALKESFAFQMDSSVDKIHLRTRLQAMPKSPHHDPKQSHHQAQQQQIVPQTEEQIQSLGCYVKLGPLYLQNGLFAPRSEMLELLPPYYVTQSGGTCLGTGNALGEHEGAVVLHLWTSLEAQANTEDQFACPIFVRSLVAPNSLAGDHHASPILQVHCNTSEDIQECEIQRMAVFAAPAWLV